MSNASQVERWVFLLRHAQDYDADQLRRLFPEIAFQQAIQSIETIALKTEDKQMYDTREKAARDHQWLISGARSEGIEKGAIIGTIRTCQSILGLTELSVKELSTKSLDELRALAIQHQSAIRGRIA